MSSSPSLLRLIHLNPSKCKWLMHEELAMLLLKAVYHGLDTMAGLTMSEHSNIVAACKKSDLSNLLDRTTTAAFWHQYSLTLH
jgi:hypothetical protein